MSKEEKMVLYALASNTQFFKVCSSGFASIKVLNCPIEAISELYKEEDIHMVAHPLVAPINSKENSNIFDTIMDMQFREDDALWDVFMTSGANYRLLV